MKNIIINKGSMECPFIYMNYDQFIGGYVELMDFILEHPNEDFQFKGFVKEELMGIRSLMIKYSEYMNSSQNDMSSTTVTHSLKFPYTQYIFVNSGKSNVSDYKLLSLYENIDEIKFRENGNGLYVIVNGIICLYGFYNEYGFYAIETDEFFTKKSIEEEENMKVEDINVQTLMIKKRNY